jgi:hypothetical protein
MKSFIYRAEFKSKTLKKFKQDVKALNTNVKKAAVKTKDQLRAEKLKHQQNIRAS